MFIKFVLLLLIAVSLSLAQRDCKDNEQFFHCSQNKDKCSDPAWLSILKAFCPDTCGFCIPCLDINKNCALAAGVCNEPTFTDYMTEKCAKTCNRC